MNWPTIDPELPTLPLAFDDNTVRARFTQQWPAQRATLAPATTLKECRRQDVQYVPATRCVTTYAMRMEAEAAAPTQTIGVMEVSPRGLHHRLYTADPHLPGLAQAADVQGMRDRFHTLGATEGEAGARQLSRVVPLRYKPGSRCALRYDYHLPSAPQHATATNQASCFGKLLARNSTQLAQTVTALAQASRQEPALPRIAEPLAYWPDLQLVLQAAVPGAELHTLAFDAQLATTTRLAWLRLAGRGIAALHTLSGHAATTLEGTVRTLAGDLTELADYQPAVRQVNPGLAARVEAATASLATIAGRQPELAPVVSHGALRTDQFLLDDNQLVLIDLDSVCWASPARDLGNLLAYLTWKALRQPQHAAFIQGAQQAFLAGYAQVRPLPATDWLVLYQAASLLKILGRRYTGLTYKEWSLTETLVASVMKLLQGGRL